jgi:hypothetical protein
MTTITRLATVTRAAAVALAMMGLASCDKGFEDMNTNPDASPQITPAYVFTKAQLDAVGNSYFATNVLLAGGSMQQFATYKDVPGIGDKYYFQQGTYPYDYFQNAYPTAVNETAEVIRAVSTDPSQVNRLAAARIWRVYIFHRLTDLYGDIPYSQAAQGYTQNLFTPKYDPQAEIYADMLKELEQAAGSFDATKTTFGVADLIYGGDVTKWTKFANSLMLRLGMRMTKVDPTSAKTWVQKAIAGGVITQDADIARINYLAAGQDFNKNPYALALRNNDYSAGNGDSNTEGGKLAKTLIDALKTTADPRLNAIAVVWNGTVADTSTALQKGMPNGLLNKPAEFKTYSEPNPNTLLKYDTPVVLISAAEVNLLLAEAAVRGWYTGDAATAYANGVSAAMRNWSLFGAAGVISPARISGYLARNPFLSSGTTEAKLEQIGTQLWVTLFPDEQEVFSSWRRTGYPKLTPVNIVGNITGGVIPRRSLYSPTEESINNAQFSAAVARQGANLLTTRVWWDK